LIAITSNADEQTRQSTTARAWTSTSFHPREGADHRQHLDVSTAAQSRSCPE
jgi:hypothetical protein